MSQQTSIDWGERIEAIGPGRIVTGLIIAAFAVGIPYSVMQRRQAALAQYPQPITEVQATPAPPVEIPTTIETPVQATQYSADLNGITKIITTEPMRCVQGPEPTIALCWVDHSI